MFNESSKSQESDLPDYEQHKNLLLTLNSSTNLQVCGSHDCPGPGTEIKRPADEQVQDIYQRFDYYLYRF